MLNTWSLPLSLKYFFEETGLSCILQKKMGSDITYHMGTPSTPQVDQIHSNRGHRDWGLNTKCHIIINPFWKIQLSVRLGTVLSICKPSGRPKVWVIDYDRPIQPFSLYLEKNYMLLVHTVLKLLDLFHVWIHSALIGQPHVKNACACLCSIHIRCFRV